MKTFRYKLKYQPQKNTMRLRLSKQSELKYLSNFRKINQTRFYKKCELRQKSLKQVSEKKNLNK